MSETPNVFLSWSGPRSKAMAEALHGWLRRVIQSARPFHSDKDIESGAFWDDAIKANLKVARFAIVCCTPENVTAPWLNYEAGALAERLDGRTAPLLLGAKPEALKVSPLSRLQAREANKAGTLDVVRALNANLLQPLDDVILVEAFNEQWQKLKDKLDAIPAPETKAPERSEKDMLEEVVGLCRQLAAYGRNSGEHYFPAALNRMISQQAKQVPDSIRQMVDEEVVEYIRTQSPGESVTAGYDLALQVYPVALDQWRKHGKLESSTVRKLVLLAAKVQANPNFDPE